MLGINKGYNVKLNGVYKARCPNCSEITSVQDADGEGLCWSCDYRWQFDKDRTVGRCVKCNTIVTVGNWLSHNTETKDERDHPLVK